MCNQVVAIKRPEFSQTDADEFELLDTSTPFGISASLRRRENCLQARLPVGLHKHGGGVDGSVRPDRRSLVQ